MHNLGLPDPEENVRVAWENYYSTLFALTKLTVELLLTGEDYAGASVCCKVLMEKARFTEDKAHAFLLNMRILEGQVVLISLLIDKFI